MVRLKFWQKESPIEETPLPYVEDDLDFWGFGPVDWESDPEFEPLAPGDLDLTSDLTVPQADFARALEALAVTARAEKQDVREYESQRQFTDFSHWETRTPIPPRSALLSPVKLSDGEKQAVVLVEMMKQHFVGELKLKPALQKKVKESKKGYRRVVFDDQGKMKVVKGA